MRNENAHYTPQQISRLVNLHIKCHQCLAVKCQNERQQLLNTIEKLARNFYDIYKVHEKQNRELNRIVNLYNDFCTQFGLPGKVEKTKQHEFSHLDKIAQMIYEHFIKMREANQKIKVPQSFEEIKQPTGPTTISRQCKKGYSSGDTDNKTASSLSSIVAIDNEENTSIKIIDDNGNKTDNGKRSLNSVLVNIGSIPATNSSLSPPECVLSRHQGPKNHCSVPSKAVTSDGNHLNDPATLVCEKGHKRHISTVDEFGALNKKRITEPLPSGTTSFAASTGLNTAFLAMRPNYSTNFTSVPTLEDSQRLSCLTELVNKRLSQCNVVRSTNKSETKINCVGGTVLITEGPELSIDHLSSFQPVPENMGRRHNTDNIIQLDDDD